MTTIDSTMRSLEIQGTTVPKLGFGTWQLNGAECEEAVRDALEIGYRHIDTAQAYGNEAEVGRGLAASGVERSDIFLTTKISPADFEPARLRAAAEISLHALGTDYVDLLLLHWPSDDVSLEATLGAMVELREAGTIRQLGVSNFPTGPLRRALATAPVSLRWLLDQHHVAAIPKAASHERRAENFEVFDFELADDERARIDALPKDQREIDPGHAPDWDA